MIKRRNIDPTHRSTFMITHVQAATIVDAVVGIVPVKSELVSVRETHGTLGSDGSAVTLSVERLQATETVGAGDVVVNATINLKGAANTVQTGTIVKTSNIHQFQAGDRVGINVAGTTTDLATMVVSLEFRPID